MPKSASPSADRKAEPGRAAPARQKPATRATPHDLLRLYHAHLTEYEREVLRRADQRQSRRHRSTDRGDAPHVSASYDPLELKALYGLVPHIVTIDPHLPDASVRLYGYLAKCAGQTGAKLRSREEMIAEINWSKGKFYAARDQLVARGYIVITSEPGDLTHQGRRDYRLVAMLDEVLQLRAQFEAAHPGHEKKHVKTRSRQQKPTQ